MRFTPSSLADVGVPFVVLAITPLCGCAELLEGLEAFPIVVALVWFVGVVAATRARAAREPRPLTRGDLIHAAGDALLLAPFLVVVARVAKVSAPPPSFPLVVLVDERVRLAGAAWLAALLVLAAIRAQTRARAIDVALNALVVLSGALFFPAAALSSAGPPHVGPCANGDAFLIVPLGVLGAFVTLFSVAVGGALTPRGGKETGPPGSCDAGSETLG